MYIIMKVSVRNILQDNAVVTRLENHRKQLDDVDVIQYM